MPFKDHFQTLRVPHRATSQQIQKAYYERLKFFHPDFFQDDPARHAIAETETKCLNEAYEALATPAAREAYLREWERHHNPLRVLSPRGVPSSLETGAKGDLSTARQQVRELQVLLEERTRDLKAATLGVRQGQDRLQQLQRTVESHQDINRKLESRLLEREVELQESRNRDGASQVQVRRLERQLADALRQVSQPRPGEFSQSAAAFVGLAAEATSPSVFAETGNGTAADAEGVDVREPADTLPASAEQRRLLDDAALQIRVLRDRLHSAEAELRRRPGEPSEAIPAGRTQNQDDHAVEIQGLRSALAERTDEVARARRQLADLQERLYAAEEGRTQGGGQPQTTEDVGWGSRVGRQVDGAAEWLSPSRATVLLTVLLVALCAVAITLILLTVSFDVNALRAGLGRLGL